MSDERIIAILGSLYCGSTALTGVLGNLPGVLSLGELASFNQGVRCSFHPECPFEQRIIEAQCEPEELYHVAARLARDDGHDVLVTADKYITVVSELVAEGEADAIVLFRHPEATIHSYRKHQVDPAEVLVAYRDIIKAVEAGYFGRVVFVSHERLVANPYPELALLCRALDLPAPLNAEPLIPHDGHCFGGNHEAFFGGGWHRRPLRLDTSWRDDPPEVDDALWGQYFWMLERS